MEKGKVYLIGAGPGDKGLITLRAKNILQKADVVIYDYLVNPDLLSYAPPASEIIYVGKKAGQHTLSQSQINQLLIKKAKKASVVARLKGGDPFIFGRGAEEALALAKEKIAFEVIPGVTSAISVPSYAGIPLTFRKVNSTVAFITGHEEEKEVSNIAWDKIAGIDVLVFLMGVKNLEFIVKKLIENKKEPNVKAAVIQWGTLPRQKTIYGNLKNIVSLTQKEGITAPAIFVVGEVVKLRDKLNWFEKKPLYSKRVLITRSRLQASSLREKLEEAGAEVVEFPAIMISEADDYAPLDNQIDNLSLFNWIIFTSVNSVEYFFRRLFKKNKDLRDLKGILIAVIGEATKEKLESYHLKADFMPSDFTSQAVIDGLKHKSISGQRILLPRSQIADESLSKGLRQLGAEVREVWAYNTVKPVMDIKLLKNKDIDFITFTSSSTVNNFVSLFPSVKEFKQFFPKTKIASIGPVTSQAARHLGLKVHIESKEHTIDGLIKAIIKSSNSPARRAGRKND